MKEVKTLQEMSLEELWQLFPIELVPPRPEWRIWANLEIEQLHSLLDGFNPIISHIGSTAIVGIHSKPIVDILVETADMDDWDRAVEIMESNGYLLMARNEGRMSFNKGYTVNGYADRVFHIHFHLKGDRDEIIFRDYLNAHPSEAKEYERLKLSLLPGYRNDRDAYTLAKSDVVARVLSIAKGSL